MFIGYVKELYPALGDAPSFTDFSPEIDRNYENESPGTFQTFSFGTDVSQMSVVRFAEENGTKMQCGDEMPYPLVFGTVLAISAPSLCLATPQSLQIIYISLFFFLNPL